MFLNCSFFAKYFTYIWVTTLVYIRAGLWQMILPYIPSPNLTNQSYWWRRPPRLKKWPQQRYMAERNLEISPMKVVFHWRLFSIEGRPPSKGVLHRRSSSIKSRLQSQRSSSIEGRLHHHRLRRPHHHGYPITIIVVIIIAITNDGLLFVRLNAALKQAPCWVGRPLQWKNAPEN